MIRRPPRSTRTDTLFPYTTLFRSLLQRDAETPIYRIAEAVNLSPSACSRRIAELKRLGYISRTVAVLDREKLGLGLTVFVIVRAQHNSDWLERFRTALADPPEEIGRAHVCTPVTHAHLVCRLLL